MELLSSREKPFALDPGELPGKDVPDFWPSESWTVKDMGVVSPETEIVAPLRLLVSGSSPGFLVSPLMSGRTEERMALPPYSGQKVQGFPVGRPLEDKGAGMANDPSRDRKDSPSDSPQRPGPAGGREKIPPEADEQRFPGREDPAPRPLPQSLSLWCARSPFLHVLDQPNSPII